MNTDPARIPVIIGVGQINDRENVHDALGLMVAALEAADMDAGGGWISQLDSIAVVNQISFPKLGDCAAHLATHFGLAPKFVEQTPYPTGESPVQLLNEAANRIGAGEIGVAAIVGLARTWENAFALIGMVAQGTCEAGRQQPPDIAYRHANERGGPVVADVHIMCPTGGLQRPQVQRFTVHERAVHVQGHRAHGRHCVAPMVWNSGLSAPYRAR